MTYNYLVLTPDFEPAHRLNALQFNYLHYNFCKKFSDCLINRLSFFYNYDRIIQY